MAALTTPGARQAWRGHTRQVSTGHAAGPRASSAPPAPAASPRPPGQPLGCNGGPERAAAPAAVGLPRRRTPRRRAGRGHAARPGGAQAPPFAPHRNLGRLRRRRALGSARLSAAAPPAPAAPPRPARRSCAGRPGRRVPAGRGEARPGGGGPGPGPPPPPLLPPPPRRGGRPSLCLQEHRPAGAARTEARSGKRPPPSPVWGARGREPAGRCLPASIPPLCASGPRGLREKGTAPRRAAPPPRPLRAPSARPPRRTPPVRDGSGPSPPRVSGAAIPGGLSESPSSGQGGPFGTNGLRRGAPRGTEERGSGRGCVDAARASWCHRRLLGVRGGGGAAGPGRAELPAPLRLRE